MNDKEFAKLVSDMRNAQRAYFASREPEMLELSKQLEKQVDKSIAELRTSQMALDFAERED